MHVLSVIIILAVISYNMQYKKFVGIEMGTVVVVLIFMCFYICFEKQGLITY